ncbi:MAG: NADH-quinone oxidoreductase subunit NuoK [Candidatus Omnitrophica bacterium]|nr:NADH-quinone oxidoreductase subunit NuoK [Candidatus Omnitrophota bacterium]
MIPLSHFLTVSAVLFAIGLYGVLARKNAVIVLMGIEIMMNAANLNLIAFSRFLPANRLTGQLFALFGITIAAAEVAVGLALVIAIFRMVKTIEVDRIEKLKG